MPKDNLEGYNGNNCRLQKDWLERMGDAMDQIAQTHELINGLHEEARFLPEVLGILKELKGTFVSAALGKDGVPMNVHKDIVQNQQDSSTRMIKVLIWAFSFALTAIVFMLTGIKYFFPHG